MKKYLLFFMALTPALTWGIDFNGWKQISTEHYTYIFEEFDEKTADELASYGEEIYERVSSFFEFSPDHITVYINSRVDSPNGNFYPIPGSIDLYPVYPLNSENTTKSASWLYELLLHEMVHYVQLENPIGFFGVLSRIFGKDLASANGAFLPAWMIEGIAVYIESQYTGGGRGNNRYFEAFMKAAALDRDFPSIEQLAYSSDFPPYNRIYSGGFALTVYMMKTYGEDIIGRIYKRYARFPLLGPFHAIKKETGKKLSSIYDDFKERESVKHSRSFALAGGYESAKISPDRIGDRYHPVETDKGLLMYRTEQDSPPALILADRQTGLEKILFEARLIENSSFDSDAPGDTVVFAAPDYEIYHSFGNAIISRLHIFEKGSIRLLTDEDSLFQPSISSDGKKIVAVRRKGSYSELVSIDRNSGTTERLFFRENANIMNPEISPSGEEVAFTVNERGMQDIYILSFSEPDSAAPLFGKDWPSEYHPRFIDNGKLSFISDRDEDLSLYSYDRKSGKLTLLFKDPVGVADGIATSQGIFYQAYRTKGYELRTGQAVPRQIALERESAPAPPALTGRTFQPEKHFDLAIPYLWLPKPYVQTSPSEGLLWGAGALVKAGSYSQSTTWTLDLNFLPGPGQPEGSFTYRRDAGRVTISYEADQSYGESELPGGGYLWKQKTEQTAMVSYPFFENSRLNWRHVLKNYAYVKHIVQIENGGGFTFSDSFSLSPYNFLYAGTGLSLSHYRINNSRRALFGGWSVFNQLDFSARLPVMSAADLSYIIKGSGEVTFPLGKSGTNLQTAWQAAYHNRGISSSAVKARGWSPRLVSSDVSLYYTASLQMPIALVDWGFPLGFNIQNLAAAFNFEGISHFLFSGAAGQEIYAGLELIGTCGYNYGSTPFGAGASFRLYDGGRSFIPAEDIQIYFFFSFDSLF